ncbi:MAG: hypothetical protein FWC89_03325 [Defluviitaleaceae bacterium]|nr:hypothetical protein [Defluviitaleaceae bacterium]
MEKLLTILLTATLALLITACGGAEDTTPAQASNSKDSNPAAYNKASPTIIRAQWQTTNNKQLVHKALTLHPLGSLIHVLSIVTIL